jgi:ATP-dependent DNA ligase
MEARSVGAIPRGDEWQYEPKWDGFRCLLSRRGKLIDLRSKSGEDLARYFPELVQAALDLKATAFLLDGEIVVPHGRSFSFDDLLQRIHPAASRIKMLSQETPALFLAFDLICRDRPKFIRTAAQQASPGTGSVCQAALQIEQDILAFPRHHEFCHCEKMAGTSRRRFGRRDRKTP